MVNTWTSSYFQTEGIRVLFVLPQSWTDRFIPMTVVPEPKQVVRVMVGRVELMTPERERQAEAAVRSLADPDGPRRLQAFAYLREQGRYVEPIIRRVQKTTNDANVRVLCRRLLLTDFVTELRAAIHNASDGTAAEHRSHAAAGSSCQAAARHRSGQGSQKRGNGDPQRAGAIRQQTRTRARQINP